MSKKEKLLIAVNSCVVALFMLIFIGLAFVWKYPEHNASLVNGILIHACTYWLFILAIGFYAGWTAKGKKYFLWLMAIVALLQILPMLIVASLKLYDLDLTALLAFTHYLSSYFIAPLIHLAFGYTLGYFVHRIINIVKHVFNTLRQLKSEQGSNTHGLEPISESEYRKNKLTLRICSAVFVLLTPAFLIYNYLAWFLLPFIYLKVAILKFMQNYCLYAPEVKQAYVRERLINTSLFYVCQTTEVLALCYWLISGMYAEHPLLNNPIVNFNASLLRYAVGDRPVLAVISFAYFFLIIPLVICILSAYLTKKWLAKKATA